MADAIGRAVKFILKAQSSQGGWYDTSKIEGHDLAAIEPTILQIQALTAARTAVSIPLESDNDGITYLKTAVAAQKGRRAERAEPPHGRRGREARRSRHRTAANPGAAR